MKGLIILAFKVIAVTIVTVVWYGKVVFES